MLDSRRSLALATLGTMCLALPSIRAEETAPSGPTAHVVAEVTGMS